MPNKEVSESVFSYLKTLGKTSRVYVGRTSDVTSVETYCPLSLNLR